MHRCFFMSLYAIDTFAAKYHQDANEVLALFIRYNILSTFHKEYTNLSQVMPDVVFARAEELLRDNNALPKKSHKPYEPHVDCEALQRAFGVESYDKNTVAGAP